MMYKLLADSVVAVHLAYVAFVVVAQVLILIGLLCRWQWVRNLRFRVIHLVMVEVVALEGWFGIICPMTDWDTQLRARLQEPNNTIAVAPAFPGPATPTPMDAGPVPVPPMPEAPMQQPPMHQPATPPAPTPPAQQPEPEPPQLPQPAAQEEPAADDGQATFVGRLLSSVLYLQVPQRVLDTWYVRFGLVTLGLFLLFPPRVGRWSASGLGGVILLWTGLLFTCATIHQRITRDGTSPAETVTPLEFGIWMVVLGAACWCWGCWRGAQAAEETTTAAAGAA